MLDNNTLIKVKNRDNGTVGYTIPELGNLHRDFALGETKEISMNELRKLAWTPGGKALLKDYLIIENNDAIAELLGDVEPEYNYTEEDVRNILTNGSLNAFLDCLDYAPEGVINLIKQIAVDTKLNDVAKRQAILEKTGFNVDSAIRINEESKEDGEEENKATGRRVPIVDEPKTKRRTAAPKEYTVISKEDK